MSSSPPPKEKEKEGGSPSSRFLGRKPTLKGLIKTMQPNLETLVSAFNNFENYARISSNLLACLQ
jgi:hypothetical protein